MNTQPKVSAEEQQSANNRWIAVEERLPEIGKPVIVYMSYGKMDTCFWDGEYWTQAIRPQHSNGSVTHWQPLPAPPTSEPTEQGEQESEWNKLLENPAFINFLKVNQYKRFKKLEPEFIPQVFELGNNTNQNNNDENL